MITRALVPKENNAYSLGNGNLNNAENDLKITLLDGSLWIIAPGEVGILKIYCLFDRYVSRIV